MLKIEIEKAVRLSDSWPHFLEEQDKTLHTFFFKFSSRRLLTVRFLHPVKAYIPNLKSIQLFTFGVTVLTRVV